MPTTLSPMPRYVDIPSLERGDLRHVGCRRELAEPEGSVKCRSARLHVGSHQFSRTSIARSSAASHGVIRAAGDR
jgi:hypothetical protein